MTEVNPNEIPVVTKAKGLNVPDHHRTLLRLCRHYDGLTCRCAVALFVWMLEVPNKIYPGTTWMAQLLGANRFAVTRAEEQLAEAGLVKFVEGRPRTFHILSGGEALQSQLIAYNHVFFEMLKEKKKGKSRKAKQPIKDSAPATNVEKSPEQNDDHADTTAQTDPQTESLKRTKTTPEDVAKICSDYKSMLSYLLYGKPGVYAPDASHPPEVLNWEQFRKGEKDLGVSEWGPQVFAGYYWSQVSLHRTQRRIDLTLPPFPKLIGHMSTLLKQVPKLQLYSIITFVVYYFDVIRWMLRRAGNTVFLDENSLVNPLVRQSANNLMAMSEPERAQLIEQFKAETGVQ
jgi:hypothetical protein